MFVTSYKQEWKDGVGEGAMNHLAVNHRIVVAARMTWRDLDEKGEGRRKWEVGGKKSLRWNLDQVGGLLIENAFLTVSMGESNPLVTR